MLKQWNNKRHKNTRNRKLVCKLCGDEFYSFRQETKTCSWVCSKKYQIISMVGEMRVPVCKNGVCELELTKGYKTFFDEEDRHHVDGKYASVRLTKDNRQYAQVKAKGKLDVLHRIVMKAPKGMVVDHIDGDGLNNRKSNLRICLNKNNVKNSCSRKGVSSFKGVCKTVSGKWRSYIAPDRKQIHLGIYTDEIEAAKAYNKAALKYFGKYALLNDIYNPGQFVSPVLVNASDHT
jgi:HNH endonuclease